jgi:signal transduction histidine kinase/CheY-like chemotaxis protein
MSKPLTDRSRWQIRKAAAGFATLYLFLGGAWIYLSDTVLLHLGGSPEAITRYQTLKGAAYVAVTALLAYCYLAKTLRRQHESLTALRRSEREFRLLTDQFHALLDAIPDNITRLSPDLRVVWANRGAAAGLKKEPADLVGGYCYTLWHNRTSPCEMCPVLKTFRTADPALEIITTPDGKTWELRSLPMKEIGSVVEVLEIGRDVTENRKLEEQVRQAQKMESVGRLAGGVAHDFNNLLTVITGYSELLLQKIGKESPMHEEVEEIKRAGERAASLTQQLLAFSRKQIIEPKVVHLDHLVAEMHKMLTRLVGEDIALQATTGKSQGSVKVDPGQFQQILMNLVVNARDAMPDGGKIVIETANVDLDEGYCAVHPYVKPGRFVMVAVSDTGKGMSEEVKAHIFEPFYTTKERGSGTGLGLATTYGAVHQAGGSIEVYSEVGIGTTFRIYLPRIEEEAVKPEKVDRPTDLPGGTETVLLVEDEDTLRTLCERILGDLGYQVMPARNGAEAIAVAQKNGERIDLLLTDVVMPGMSGRELATQLVLHHPEMKVLFMSGYTDDAIGKHGVLDEGVSFIGKPYTPSALARKVREVLDEA